MRILIIIKRFSPKDLIGGTEKFALTLAEKLLKRGSSVQVVSATIRGEWKKAEEVIFSSSSQAYTIPVKRLPHPSMRFLGTLVYNASLLAFLLRKRLDYDLVYVNFASFEAATSSIAKILTSKPIVCKIACSGPCGDIGQVGRRWYRGILFLLLRRIERFVSLNKETAEELERIGISKEQIVSIPNGVDAKRFAPVRRSRKEELKRTLGFDPKEKVIVSVGRLAKQKSFPTLLKALEQLKSNGIPWRAFIIGKGKEYPFLEDLKADLGLQSRVTITSESRDICKYLSAADVFVLPSRREGLSNALLEAMASGLPCVCSDIPGNNDLIQHCANGILFAPGDHVELAVSIDLLLGDEKIAARLARNARRTICSRYTIDIISGEYERIFSQLINYVSSSGPHDLNGSERHERDKRSNMEERLICK